MKISGLFKINIKKTTTVNEFNIGKNRFVIIEITTGKTQIITDKVLTFLLTSSLEVYWFLNYYEFENNINYLIDDNHNSKTIFIIIG